MFKYVNTLQMTTYDIKLDTLKRIAAQHQLSIYYYPFKNQNQNGLFISKSRWQVFYITKHPLAIKLSTALVRFS
ncbi:hypothetical protein JOC37_002605 [Desulfohalotomaculum tongense]|nr:hypothetical protein [Desulforadius tongensis]